MKKPILISAVTVLLASVGALVTIPSSAAAATAIATPAGGECYKAGSQLTLTWSSNDLFKPSYSYVSYGTSTTPAPKYPAASTIAGGDKVVTTSLQWMLPAATGSDYVVYVGSMSGLNTVYSQATSQPFSIDASRPSKPVLSKSSVTTTSVHLHWAAASDAGCMPLSGYAVVRDGTVIAKTTSTSFVDSNRKPGVTYRYQIVAYDAFASTTSSLLSVTTPRPAVPVAPTRLVPVIKTAPTLPAAPHQATPELPAVPAKSPSYPTALPTNDTGLAVWSPASQAPAQVFSPVSQQHGLGQPALWLVAVACAAVAVVILLPVATAPAAPHRAHPRPHRRPAPANHSPMAHAKTSKKTSRQRRRHH